jgi:hypothetical protein
MQTVKKYQEVYIEGSLKMNMVWWFFKKAYLGCNLWGYSRNYIDEARAS